MSRDGTPQPDPPATIASLQARVEELERECLRERQQAARERSLLRGILDAAPQPTTVVDLEGRILQLNQAACTSFRAGDREQLLGRSAFDFIPEQLRPAAGQLLRTVLERGEIPAFEVALQDPQGAERKARATVTLLRDGQGEPQAIVGTTIDPEYCRAVTAAELRRAESLEALSRLAIELAAAPVDAQLYELIASRLLAATGAQAAAVSRYDPVTCELTVQGLCTRAGLGSSGDALARATFAGLRLPVDDGLRERMLAQVINAPADLHEVTFGRVPRGRCEQVTGRLGFGELRSFVLQQHGRELLGTAVLMMPQGQPAPTLELLQVLANLVAVTLQRADAEEALRESNERFTMFMEHFPSDAVIKDSQGRIVYANPRYAAHAGHPLAEILGRSAGEVWGSDDAARLDRDDLDVLSGHEILGRERPHGERTISSYKFLIPRVGKPPLIGGFTIDVTERARLEARVRQTQKLEGLGVLAGGIAHDFNNLLTGILGHASLALADLAPDSPGREGLQLVITSARAAADLTRQMLAFSGQGAVMIRPLDLSALVAEVAPLLEITVSKKSVIKYALERGLPAVEVDSAQLRQILMLLLTNASEAIGSHGGLITVSTSLLHCSRDLLDHAQHAGGLAAGSYLCLTVSDNGCGMEPGLLARIYDPFFTTKQTGRGLGLAAVVGIVRAHHGAIRVESAPGRGTTFQVLLPPSAERAEQATARPRRTGSLHEWRPTGTVLVVDDEDFVRLSAVRILDRAGFQVITASDGQEAVDWVRELGANLRLVLLDVSMPRLGGAEALLEIRRLQPELRVVLSSGYTEAEATKDVPADHFAGFAQKPYDLEDLLSVVRDALEE